MPTRRANAMPTKRFFIYNLVKDIDLEKAISELVDNCMDGASTIRTNGDYDGLKVELKFSRDIFRIKDNCGGISIKTAQEVAFRFGRPDEVESEDYSVGRFGIGMKRALFKLGNRISVISKTKTNTFKMKIDLNHWAQDPDDWTFSFLEVDDDANNSEHEVGTVIEVTNLHNDIAELFEDDNFNVTLRRDLILSNKINLDKGISIMVDGNQLKASPEPFLIYNSEEIKPAYKTLTISEVEVKIVVGIGEASPPAAGWYIFCNDRLIVEADKTANTGWERLSGTKKYHNDYARFRGYVFFKAKDSRLLPWNTTKTGMDTTHDVYRQAKKEMIKMMNQLMPYLKKVKDEKRKGYIEIEQNIKLTERVDVFDLHLAGGLLGDEIGVPAIIERPKKMQVIKFERPFDQVEMVRKKLGVGEYKEVGEKIFDWYVKEKFKE